MYKIINFCAFLGCIVWLYIDPSPEPVVVLLLSVAGFFRDDIHGIIGKNIFRLTPKNSLIRDFESAKYSFVSSEFINPRILEDLIGWLSDTGSQVVSINVADSNRSNRYFGDITHKETESGFPRVTSSHDEGWFSYQYLGRSFSGVHLVQTSSNGGGSGIFCNILLVTLSLDSALEYGKDRNKKSTRFVIKLIGSLPLGDRYEGSVSYKFGFLTIPSCQGIRTLRERKSIMLVL